jgi:hypothetical protein
MKVLTYQGTHARPGPNSSDVVSLIHARLVVLEIASAQLALQRNCTVNLPAGLVAVRLISGLAQPYRQRSGDVVTLIRA